jgi:hypothetical protein
MVVVHGEESMSPSLTKRMQISEEELERRRAVAPRRSPKTLSHLSQCRISNGRGFGGLLSWTAVHAVAEMGKTRGQHIKRNWVVRETEGTSTFQICLVS